MKNYGFISDPRDVITKQYLDTVLAEIRTAAANAQTAANQASSAAQTAQTAANQASSAAQTAQTTANEASSAASDAATAAAAAQAAADAKAPANHASTATTYGPATGSNYGHVKLSASVTSTSAASSGVAATPSAVKSVNDKVTTLTTNLNGKKIASGQATISYAASATSVSVSFGITFSAAPAVVVAQVFDGAPIVVKIEDISTTKFTARLGGGFSSSGTRQFSWVAVGT